MARNIKRIVDGLGAQVVGRLPDIGGGAFGAARMARIVANLQGRLVPGQGKRAGRPSDASWVRHPKVPMSEETRRRLTLLADRASAGGRKISPMQLAAQILRRGTGGDIGAVTHVHRGSLGGSLGAFGQAPSPELNGDSGVREFPCQRETSVPNADV